jgi:AcrR family transcriptional regulator
MSELEKTSRRQACIFQAVGELLSEVDYPKFTIEEVASRAGVGKSTIYRWWKNRSDLIFAAFCEHTSAIFELDFEESLRSNLIQQLEKLSIALDHPIGRALLVVMAENREAAGLFFHEYLLPRREQMRKLVAVSIQRQEIVAEYPFELMLDAVYGAIHYQIIFFNRIPDRSYIEQLVDLLLRPILVQSSSH